MPRSRDEVLVEQNTRTEGGGWFRRKRLIGAHVQIVAQGRGVEGDAPVWTPAQVIAEDERRCGADPAAHLLRSLK
jgi:hypothetical protein